ncbi:hypothetical protein KU6B_42640 [Mameliella alba]|nr:hypothetical protein KU6B_42640 [Mameliella alba]
MSGMTRLKDLPGKIPVFPLPGALLLPRARLPLHIFEPRYLAMLDDCLKTETRLIGMIQPHQVPGREERGLHRIGCAGRVTQFSETEDGRYMITLTGISRFRIVREVEGFTPYRCCEVNWDGFERDQQGPRRTRALSGCVSWTCWIAFSRPRTCRRTGIRCSRRMTSCW